VDAVRTDHDVHEAGADLGQFPRLFVDDAGETCSTEEGRRGEATDSASHDRDPRPGGGPRRPREGGRAGDGDRRPDGARAPEELAPRNASLPLALAHLLELDAELLRRRVLAREPLKAIEERLDRDVFVRVHRSAIVNTRCIQAVEPLASGDQRLVLTDGTVLRVSRTHRAALLQLIRP
jgi:hypothetical protein